MKGYVRQRGDRYYAVIYEGRDPVTGKERRTWHPAGTDRGDAERLAAKLAAAETNRAGAARALTFGAYLTGQRLPAKKSHLATSTYRGYERNAQLHILPTLGKVAIRRLRYQQIEALYDTLLHPAIGRGMAPKTVYEIHLIINGALADALRRGLVTRNVAVVARAPKQRSLQRTEGVSLTEDELRQLMRTAAGHRLFPLYWLAATTGMRRSEVLGLKWPDIDFTKQRLHLNRGLVAVGYEVHETRGKTKTARRAIALDDTTLTILAGWRAFQTAEFAAVGIINDGKWVFTDGDGQTVHPHAVYETFKRIVHNAGIPAIRSRSAPHPRQPADQRRNPGQGRQRTARSRQHRVHDADLPTHPSRHASRRRQGNRATHPPRSPARHRLGGTPEEPTEEDCVNRRNTHQNGKGPGR